MERFVRILLYVLALIYVVAPYDFDSIPLIGRIDDLIVVIGVLLYCKFILPRRMRRRAERKQREAFDPYEVLSVPKDATREEVMKAYFKQKALFERARIDDLGEEFQRTATEKMEQIERAYQILLERSRHTAGE